MKLSLVALLIAAPVFAQLEIVPDAQPQAVRAIAKTISQASDFIQSNFDETLEMLKAEFPKIDGRAIVRSMERDRSTYPRGALMSESMWENGIKVAKNMRTVKITPAAAEGEIWTNKFLT